MILFPGRQYQDIDKSLFYIDVWYAIASIEIKMISMF